MDGIVFIIIVIAIIGLYQMVKHYIELTMEIINLQEERSDLRRRLGRD